MKINKKKKKIKLLVTIFILILVILLIFTVRNGNTVKNPLLDGAIRYTQVIDINGKNGIYCYKYIDVSCSLDDIVSMDKTEYIEFLEKGVSSFSTDVGIYEINIIDTDMSILYRNGDSKIGYYVDRSTDSYVTYLPTDPRCKLKGFIIWDDTNITYQENQSGQLAGDVCPPLDSRYFLPESEYTSDALPMT